MPPCEQYHRTRFMNQAIPKRSKIDSPGPLSLPRGASQKLFKNRWKSPASDFGRRDPCRSWPSQWTGNEHVDVQVPTATVPDLISWVQGLLQILEDRQKHQDSINHIWHIMCVCVYIYLSLSVCVILYAMYLFHVISM